MNLRRSLLSAAALSILSLASAQATTIEIFSESFPNYKRGWAATTRLVDQAASETAVPNTESNGWTAVGTVFEVGYSIRLGNSSYDGILYSPSISLSEHGVSGTATLSFHAARTANIGLGNTITVTVVDSSLDPVAGVSSFSPGSLVDVDAMGDTDLANCQTNLAGDVIQYTFTGLPNTFRLKFAPTGSKSTARVAVGNIVMFQALPVLAPPMNLRTSGDVGANDFSVTWNASANAQGYSVKLLDTNGGVVSSNDVAAATTSASFTGLTSSSAYTVVVVALGNHTTTDDSAPATLAVTTAASAIAAPTLVVANKNWTAGVAGTSAVSATLEGDVACTIESVSMSDGSTATVANGILSWTPPLSAAASTVTATFHVTHGSDGWDVSDTLSVAATPAPAAPVVLFDNVTSRSFDASWSVSGGGPVSFYKVRAWTGRATPDNPTGGTNENFATYAAGGSAPAGWTFVNAEAYTTSQYAAYPVGFKSVSGSAISPDYGASLSSVSFRLRAGTGSFIVSAAPSGSDNWTAVTNYTSDAGTFTTELKTVELNESAGYSKIKLEFVRTSGSAAFGTFTVSGTDWPAADFLEGWGGTKTDVGLSTSQTISNPVAGETNYVEVTAVGPAGATTSTIASVAVPDRPSVISVK